MSEFRNRLSVAWWCLRGRAVVYRAELEAPLKFSATPTRPVRVIECRIVNGDGL